MTSEPTTTEPTTSEPTPDPPGPVAVAPVDLPMAPFAVGGMVAWAVAGLALLPLHDRLDQAGHGSWPMICLAGFLLGIPGLLVMLRHDAARRQRLAGGDPPS